MSDRQDAINALYAAYCNAGDDDMNARARIQDDAMEFIAVGAANPEKCNLETFLCNALPITEDELDRAEAAYLEKEE